MSDNPQRRWRFRQAIEGFISERRDAKLKGEGESDAAGKYEYTTWLGDAARRVAQIQAVTHVLKATHPDARGSSLHCPPASLHPHDEIGTHSLGDVHADDIVGNAAALDVYKFLKVEVEERRLLDWLLAEDADLLAALHDDESTAREWAAAFSNLIRNESGQPASHAMAKQLYWCVSGAAEDDDGYHLLQPLFSSSLAQAIHADISEARFGEANREVRRARRAKAPHHGEYHNYQKLVARRLGGTKPQNISQLNSERGGVNYLLASLPPSWKQDIPRDFLRLDSALERFARFPGVAGQLKALADFLVSDPPPTVATRQRRERIERALGDSLAAFGLDVQDRFPPGWTRDDDCRLPDAEKLWLDPGRAELEPRPTHEQEDRRFTLDFHLKDWLDQIATSFAHWVNAYLKGRDLPVGDVEAAHWARQAIVEVAAWPAPLQRRLFTGGTQHG
ncbi:type I-F CRISPR-associated protein Csy1 [Pseudomonas sp. NY15437]|uniref:type I-F CRISPR-associated protein Csy1 n=1 Tax=Pseudomonas sp. NY15437 TaxID=3400360 RepID=UPI003A84ADE6